MKKVVLGSVALMLAACGGSGGDSESQPLTMYPSSAVTSEGGRELWFHVHVPAGETASWQLTPEFGTLTPIGPDNVVYTPPPLLDDRKAFTAVALAAKTANGHGTADLHVYPDPCGAGGRWWMSLLDPMPDPPDGCGPCVGGAWCAGMTPPEELLLGGSITAGAISGTFDLASCTWTVTASDDGTANAFCLGRDTTPPYAGLTSNFTFERGQGMVIGEQRLVCWGETTCCAPLLTVALTRE